jgi:DNA polymerase III epsilon subunit-like protein
MTLISVDVEATGGFLSPPFHSLLSIGAVVIEPGLGRTFYTTVKPLPEGSWEKETIKIHGFTPEMAAGHPPPEEALPAFHAWLKGIAPHDLRLVSDTSGFDWMHIAYYLSRFCGNNPFGFQGINVQERYTAWRQGCIDGASMAHELTDVGTVYRKAKSFPHLSKMATTPHTHNALDDAMGLAESVLEAQKLGFRL